MRETLSDDESEDGSAPSAGGAGQVGSSRSGLTGTAVYPTGRSPAIILRKSTKFQTSLRRKIRRKPSGSACFRSFAGSESGANERAQPTKQTRTAEPGTFRRDARLSVFYWVIRASCANGEASASLSGCFFIIFKLFPEAMDTPPCPRVALG